MSRPSILALGRFDGDAGTEHVSAIVLGDLARDCDVRLLAWGTAGSFFAQLRPALAGLYRFSTGRGSGVRNALRLWLHIARFRPRAVIAFDYRMALPLGMALGWLPVSLRPRSVLSHHLPLAFRLAQAAPRERRRAMACLPRFDMHTVPSAPIAGELQQVLPALPAERIRVLPNGVDVAALQLRAQEASPLPLQEGVRYRCVFVGALRPDKRVDLLLQALHALPERQACQLLVIGDGSERERLQAEMERLQLGEHCVFVGAVANPHPLLAAADLYVQISRRETFGLAPLEAMAHGVPVLAMCEQPDGLRTVLQDGVQGRLLEGQDAEAFAVAWHALLQDNEARRRMGEAGRAQAARFSLAAMCDGYRRLLGVEAGHAG